jgi:hypothetical protein
MSSFRTIRTSDAGIEILVGEGAPVIAPGAVLLGACRVSNAFKALMWVRSSRASKASLGRVRKLARAMWVHLPLGIDERAQWKRVYAEAWQRTRGSGQITDHGFGMKTWKPSPR